MAVHCPVEEIIDRKEARSQEQEKPKFGGRKIRIYKSQVMDAMQVALPILGIVAAAAVTFYAVSFSEIREVIISLLRAQDFSYHMLTV